MKVYAMASRRTARTSSANAPRAAMEWRRGVLAQFLLLALWSASAGAQIPTLVVEVNGERSELKGSDAQCVHDSSGLHCTASPQAIDRPLAEPAVAVTKVFAAVAVKNDSAVAQTFIIIATLPTTPILPSTLIGGSVGAATTDANYNGSGGLSTAPGAPLYRALIDDVVVATLDPDPTVAPGPMFPGTFSFPGASVTVPAQSFGLPGPSQVGPAVAQSIAIQLEFRVAAGDSAALTAVFGVIEGAAGAAAVGRSGQDAAPPTLPSAAVAIAPRSVALSGVGSCSQYLSAEFAVVNNAGSSSDYTLQFPAMVAPIGMTAIGGSIAGVVTDASFDGSGGMTTTGTDPLYQGLIDSSPVAGAALYPAPFALPGAGSFAAAGQSEVLPAASFGLPGPTGAGPSLMSSIAIEYTFTLAAGDAFAATAFFVVDCAPTPTSTPTATATGTATTTGTATATATATTTAAPDGAACTDPSDCLSDNCVDDVCCADPACPPGQSCNNPGPGNAGMCSPDPASPAPAASPSGLLAMLAAVVLVAFMAIRAKRQT